MSQIINLFWGTCVGRPPFRKPPALVIDPHLKNGLKNKSQENMFHRVCTDRFLSNSFVMHRLGS